MSARADVQPLPAWLAWPIRVLAIIFVVPFKLAWDALGLLWKYVGAPLVEHVIQPFLYYVIWLPLRWITVHILWLPLVWITGHVLAPVFSALWTALVRLARALGPFWRLLGRALLGAARAVGWALALLHRSVLTPIGRAIAFVWRWVMVPVGRAVAWAWNHSVVLLWHYLVVVPVPFVWYHLVVVPVSFVWRHLVVPLARWVHTRGRPAASAPLPADGSDSTTAIAVPPPTPSSARKPPSLVTPVTVRPGGR